MTEQHNLPNEVDGQPWWRSAVFYQIYPRSFLDTTGNGVGDLRGVINKLDHLDWLGIDAIWLSPFFPSPMVDHGYDVADYCDVDPLFGDLDLFDDLVSQAHSRGIRVMIDWVPNHSSDQHEWFIESRSSRNNPKRDWYIWSEGNPDNPPNNWQAEFPEGPAWTWDETTESWYLHLFTPEQPDLNWGNPEVREAMAETLRFWLDRGVDGFRMDVIHLIGKPEGLPDHPEGAARIVHQNDVPVTHKYLKVVRELLDSYPQAPTSIGEVALLDPTAVARYYGDNDELHMSFNFTSLFAPWDPDSWRQLIALAEQSFEPIGAWPTWALSNHDFPRHRTRYDAGEAAARAAAILLLTLRGTPFIYAGEEMGLEDADVPVEDQQDPGGWRDGCRAPIPWTAESPHGWVGSDNWLPYPPHPEQWNAETLKAEANSITRLYRELIQLRHDQPAFRIGSQRLVDLSPELVAWERTHDDSRFLVVVNMSPTNTTVNLDGDWSLEMSSDAEVESWEGSVGANSAVVLQD